MRKIKRSIFISVSLFFVVSAFLCSGAILPVDKVFRFSAQRINNNTIRAQWKITEGYHLYKEETSILLESNNGTILDTIVYPEGKKENNETLGEYEVYRDKLLIDIPVIQWGKGDTKLMFKYQGCKDSSICYQPISKIISFAPPKINGNGLSSPTLSSTKELLESENIVIVLLSFFIFGIFLSLTPCVLPMIPILIGIIMGQKEVKGFRTFMLSIIYVLGVALTYTIAGILTALLGNSIQALLQNFWVVLSCSLLFVLLSLSLFGLYELQIPSSLTNKINNLSSKTRGGSYVGVFLMGVISSLVVSPCVSAPLAGALLYIASTGNIFLGGSALFSLSLGMGVLLVIVGVTGGKLFLKTGPWMVTIRYFLGIAMLCVAIWLASRVVSQFVITILWSVLMIGVGFYAGAIEPLKGYSPWQKFRRFIAFLLLVLGIAMFLNSFSNERVVLTSDTTNVKVAKVVEKEAVFKVVTTIEELQKLIKLAEKEEKFVIIDYSAKWCTLCKEMEAVTFKNPEVTKILASSFISIRADITKDDKNSTALKKKYNVFLPPFILFLDRKGIEIKESSIAGYVGPEELVKQLNKITSYKF